MNLNKQPQLTGFGWIDEQKKQAFDRFQKDGWPSSREERWKYTQLDSMSKMPWHTIEAESQVEVSSLKTPFQTKGATIHVLNGKLMTTNHLPDSVRVGSLLDHADESHRKDWGQLANRFPKLKSSLVDLNTSYLRDVLFIHVPKNVVVQEPITLWHWVDGAEEATSVQSRVFVILDAGAQVSLIEGFLPRREKVYFHNIVQEIILGEGSICKHLKIQDESRSAFHTSQTSVQVQRSAVYQGYQVYTGAKLSRQDLNIFLEGEGAEAELRGLFCGSGDQHVDFHNSVDHLLPYGISRSYYRGIVNDRAQGVFDGRIAVSPQAQKTSAELSNKNLILSKDALINSKPLLEIFANDVKCAHGATTGQLDEASLFYLRARGLDVNQARQLLTEAFALDVLKNLEKISPEAKDYCLAAVRQHVAGGAQQANGVIS